MSIVTALAVSLIGQTLPAKLAYDEPYGLRGAIVGMTLENFKEIAIPTDSDDIRRVDPEPICRDEAAEVVCQWHAGTSGSQFPSRKSQMFTAIGNGGGYVDFKFIEMDGDYRLATMIVRSNMTFLDGMLVPMTTVYGKPTISSQTVQNGFGAQFEKQIFEWNNSISSMTLETRCGRLESLCLIIVDKALAGEQELREDIARGNAAERL